jgi:hypothetical protein
MKSFKLFLIASLVLGLFTNTYAQDGIHYEAEEAEFFANKQGQDDHVVYNDITPFSGTGYVMTGYAGLKWYIEIEEAGDYKLSIWGCSGDKNTNKTGALAIDQPHTDVPGVDPGNNRYTVAFTWPYSYDEGAVRKFEKLTFAEKYYFTAGEHYIVYDSWDPGTWSHTRIDYLEVERAGVNAINETKIADTNISVNNGTAKVIPAISDTYNLSVYDFSGNKIRTKTGLSGDTEVNGLPKGAYIFQVNGLSNSTVQKIIIR